MPNFWASCCSRSTLTLTILTLPGISLAISSSKGAIILQGPHHSAQKSAMTSLSDLRTSLSKSRAPTEETLALIQAILSHPAHIASQQPAEAAPGEYRQDGGQCGGQTGGGFFHVVGGVRNRGDRAAGRD